MTSRTVLAIQNVQFCMEHMEQFLTQHDEQYLLTLLVDILRLVGYVQSNVIVVVIVSIIVSFR